MPSYINPKTGQEDPSITDRSVTAVFTYASDDESDAEMRGWLVDRLVALAQDAGYDLEIHNERMTD